LKNTIVQALVVRIGGPFKERSCEAVKELLGKIWAVAGQPEGGLFAFKSISHSEASRDET